ncbi:MAG: hypothetical protein ACLTMP_07975 [Eggerthella lenta]
MRQAVSIELADAQSVDVVSRVCRCRQGARRRGGLVHGRQRAAHGRASSPTRARRLTRRVRACGSVAPAGSTFAVAGGEIVEARFGVAPAVRAVLGRDRVETEALVSASLPWRP